MKKGVLWVIVLFSLGCSKNGVSPQQATRQYDFSSVDHYLEQNAAVYRDQVVVLVSQNNEIIYQKEINMTSTTEEEIASASKWLSGAVIMTLVDEKKLSLDDTIGTFLPIFSLTHKGRITIRQLFSHTSGFPGNSPQLYEYRKNFTLAQAVDSITVNTEMIHEPGGAFHYGGVSMHIAGRIAEIVSGKSWQVLFDEKIAAPCEMKARYALMSTQNPLISGGVRTTARDYLNFLEMIVNKGTFHGKRVLSEPAIEELLRDQTAGATLEETPYPANLFSPYPSTSIRYGMGNWRDVVDQAGNALETSSPGAFGTHPWQDAKNKLAGIIFTRTTQKVSNATSLKTREMIRTIVEQ